MNTKTKLLNVLREPFKFSLLEKGLRQLTQQKTADSFWVKLLPNNYQYAQGSIRYATQNNIKFELDISDLVDWHVYFGIRETAQEKLFSLCAKGDTVIDVGTNIGKVLLNFSQIVGDSGKVIGFEPDGFNFKKCEKNIALNAVNNVQLFQLGLGNEATQVQMVIKDAHNRGMNRITAKSTGDSATGNVVQITTLDSLSNQLAFTKLKLIKIDVEGFEMKVLQGALATLQKFHPLLFIELDDDNLVQQGATASELIEFLLKLKYTIQRADNGETLTSTSHFSHCHFDIICS